MSREVSTSACENQRNSKLERDRGREEGREKGEREVLSAEEENLHSRTLRDRGREEGREEGREREERESRENTFYREEGREERRENPFLGGLTEKANLFSALIHLATHMKINLHRDVGQRRGTETWACMD